MEIENLHKAGPIAIADYTLYNVGTMFDFEKNLDKFTEWLEEQNE